MEFHFGRLIDHVHLRVSDLETSKRFYLAVVASLGMGGRDNGSPSERSYHPGYYGAFVLDPDGNNIEAVFHGEATRSADSVVVTPVVSSEQRS